MYIERLFIKKCPRLRTSRVLKMYHFERKPSIPYIGYICATFRAGVSNEAYRKEVTREVSNMRCTDDATVDR